MAYLFRLEVWGWEKCLNLSTFLKNFIFLKYESSRRRFEDILKYIKFSKPDNRDKEIIDFVDAVNENFLNALSPGDHLCLDESMIKAYHKDLTGKVKIIRKPRPVGNEIKDEWRSHPHCGSPWAEWRQRMQEKEFVPEYGATTATVLRLTKDFQGTGRTVIADSWFGSVKSAAELMKVGLYSWWWKQHTKITHENS